ncbi:MAG TPA: DNA/RNA non-specific endonuclease, partial [Bacteroidales bacterium]
MRIAKIALFIGISLSSFSCHKDESSTVTTDKPVLTPTGSFPENFEYGTKSSYQPGSVILSSGSWYFDDAVIGNSSADKKNGAQSARIRNSGKLIMLFDKTNGADTVSINHASYSNDGSGSWELWMSADGGNSWTKTGSTINTSTNGLSKQIFIIKHSGKIRFEVLKTDGSSNQMNIDDITIGDYTDSPVTQPATGDTINMLLGNPSNATSDIANANNYLMVKPQYCLSYSNSKLTPNWTSWHVTLSDLGSTPRQDDYRADVTLPAGWYQAVTNEYSGSGFDRGHMCPSADRTSSVTNNSATFLMTNMIPQAPNNNQVTWADLENYCRTLVNAGNELYIISGPNGKGGTGSNGYAETVGHGVLVPSQTWKIVVVLPNGDNDLSRITTSTRVIAVLMPNNQTVSGHPWGYYRVSVDQIESLTGYDFLSKVPVS